jgi:hypothetical protein
MDLTDSRILETASDMLSDFNFSEEELGQIFEELAKIYGNESPIQPILENLVKKMQDRDDPQFNNTNLTAFLKNESNRNFIQKFFLKLLENPTLVERIQNLTISKIFGGQESEKANSNFPNEDALNNSEL